MHSSLGARLREQRERQQVDLTAISAQTKIKLGLLEALERDNVSLWPKGIFGRAYLRDYARAIGLDPEPLVREFYERYPDPIIPVPAHPAEDDPESVDTSTPFRRLMTSVFPGLRQRPQKPDPVVAALAVASGAIARSEYEDVLEDVNMAHVHQTTAEAYEAIEMADDRPSTIEFAEPELPPAPAPETLDSFEASDPPRLELAMEIPGRETTMDAIERLTGAAHLCTRLAQVVDWRGVDAVLADAARLLDAAGLIVWSWDPRRNVLTPSLAHGYSGAVLARLPPVCIDEGHALATAFRTMDVAIVDGGGGAHGALVVPLMAPRGCIGVFALELRNRAERHDTVRAVATILAAQLVTLIDHASASEAVSA